MLAVVLSGEECKLYFPGANTGNSAARNAACFCHGLIRKAIFFHQRTDFDMQHYNNAFLKNVHLPID